MNMFTKKKIWALLIPLIIEQMLTSLMGTADSMMVTSAGSAAISAVSLVDSLNVLIIYIFSAMATGGAIICAQYLGRKEGAQAGETGRQLILSVSVISVVIMIICLLLREPLLRLIFGQVEAEVMTNAQTYLFITALSYPFIALYNAAAALFRVDGNSRLPMVVATVSNIINIIGNAVLIFVFDMGVAGAAIATLLSRIISAVAVLYCLRQPHQSIVVRDYLKIRPDMKRIRSILSVGIPNGIENGMFQIGKLAIQSTVSTMGTVAIAGQSMTSILESFTCNGAIAVGLGMMTIVGQYMGAGLIEEAKKAIKQLTFYAEITILVLCALMALLVKPITILSGMEPDAAKITIELTYIICIVKPFVWALAFVPAYGLRAAGDVRFSMITASCTMWLCRVALAISLVKLFHFGPIAVWIGMFTDWFVRSIIFTLRVRSGKWTQKHVIQD